MRIGIDAGGTFTDFILCHDSGALETFKLRSDPRSPAKVILAGLAQAAGLRKAQVVHGSTVATNALLERKGVRTALVTTAGFEDVIAIGRQNRAELYNLTPAPRVPPHARILFLDVPAQTRRADRLDCSRHRHRNIRRCGIDRAGAWGDPIGDREQGTGDREQVTGDRQNLCSNSNHFRYPRVICSPLYHVTCSPFPCF